MADNTLFPKMARNAFINAADAGAISSHVLNNVLKYDGVDTTIIKSYLKHKDPWVRSCTAKVIGKHGPHDVLIAAVKVEREKDVLLCMINELSKCKVGLDELIQMLSSEDDAVLEEMIIALRSAGRSDLLFGLAFSDDESIASRVKMYIEEGDGTKPNI